MACTYEKSSKTPSHEELAKVVHKITIYEYDYNRLVINYLY